MLHYKNINDSDKNKLLEVLYEIKKLPNKIKENIKSLKENIVIIEKEINDIANECQQESLNFTTRKNFIELI